MFLPLYLWNQRRRQLWESGWGGGGEMSQLMASSSGFKQHNVFIYHNLKANECSYVYIEVKANIL